MNNKDLLCMQVRIHQLEMMQAEFNIWLNWVVLTHGTIPEGGTSDDATYILDRERLMSIKMLAIRSEISEDGKRMTIRRFDPKITPSEPKRIITL